MSGLLAAAAAASLMIAGPGIQPPADSAQIASRSQREPPRMPDAAAPSPPAEHEAAEAQPRRTAPVPIRRLLIAGQRVLLPEGTYMIRTPGTLFPESDDGLWKFLPRDFGSAFERAVPLAPSPALERVASIAIPDRGLEVELSGELLAYRGRNWVLPELVVPLRRAGWTVPAEPPPPIGALTTPPQPPAPTLAPGEPWDPVEPTSEADAAKPTEAVGGAGIPDPPAAPPSEESDAIERMLRDRIGAVPVPIEVLPPREIALPEFSAAIEGPIDAGPAPPQETLVVARRGTIVRDNDRGGWRFVPVSADGGTPEESMRILPSAVLERAERSVRAAQDPIPVLVTGRVLRFRDEVWLRLTAYELPRTGRSIFPG
ncbi:MAG TPA: hypothetical protein PKC43_12665 [Phycisphaerales bacterium]|nr:hypothetical protein [Phycisphaerales bacterium]HMP38285.1 hypothetical protein [Phycisphaerales bacterium]